MRLGQAGHDGELGRRPGHIVLVQQMADVQAERDRQEDLKAAGKFSTTAADAIPNSVRAGFVGEEFGEACQCVNDLEEAYARQARGIRFFPDPEIKTRRRDLLRHLARGSVVPAAEQTYQQAVEAMCAEIAFTAPEVPIEAAIAALKRMLREEVVQVAALAVAWLEGLDNDDTTIDLTVAGLR